MDRLIARIAKINQMSKTELENQRKLENILFSVVGGIAFGLGAGIAQDYDHRAGIEFAIGAAGTGTLCTGTILNNFYRTKAEAALNTGLSAVTAAATYALTRTLM